MSGVVSVGVAATAIGVAAATGFETFAVIAAVGATIGAVGGIAHIKELQYAGAAIGAVGLIGGLANAAGMFGETGLFGPGGAFGPEPSFGASGAGELGLSGGAPAASGVDSGTWAGVSASPTTGYDSAGTFGQGITAGEAPGFTAQNDVITMTNGTPTVGTGEATTPLASAPNVTPSSATDALSGTTATETASPSFTGLGETGGTPVVEAPAASNITGQVPDPAKSLINGGRSLNEIPVDAYGNVIPHGDATGGTLGTTGNPAAPTGEGWNTAPPPAPVTGTNTPSGVAGADNSVAGFGSGSTGTMDMAPASQVTGNPNSILNGGGDLHLSGAANVAPKEGSGLDIMGRATDVTTPGYHSYGSPQNLLGSEVPGSSWSGIMNFLTKHPPLMYGAIQTMGSFLSGAVSPVPQATVDELESRRRANDAATALALQQQQVLQQRFSNMTAPMPVAGRSLINGGSAITGRPA
jgi:hypothetical protein